MRRTKHRRRYHTGRVISNRQRRHLLVDHVWVYLQNGEHPLWVLENGRLDDTDRYHDCGHTRCNCCHNGKWDSNRRDIEKRAWRREVEEQLAERPRQDSNPQRGKATSA